MARAVFRLLLVTIVLACVSACKEDTGVQVKSLKFTGNNAVSTDQLKKVLATSASSRFPWGTKRYFSREQFEADLKRIVAFYTDRGYPDARVTSFDAKLSSDQASVDLTINISEGEPLLVERIQFEGFESLPEEHRDALRTRLPLEEGQPLDRALLQASREAALDELRDHGHPYASVRLGEDPGTSDRNRVLTLRADPGPVAHHGDVEITGNANVSEKVIRRQLTFKPGDLYRQSRLQESQRKLYSLELFEFANIEPVGEEARPVVVPTRVTVTKSDHQKVRFGVGYGTEEKARAEIDWRHVNAFGAAQTVGVFARYSGLDRGVRLTYREPYVFTPYWSLGVNGQMWHTDEPAFTLDTTGGRVTATREFAQGGGFVLNRRPRTSLSFTYANEHEDYTISEDARADLSFRDELIALGLDPRTGRHEGQRSAISFDFSRNTADNLLDAKRGYIASVHLENAGGFLGGTYRYREVTGEGRFYQQLGNFAVFAVQARSGILEASGPPDVRVPFFKRYFLGGATNLRGWGRFEMAPLTDEGLPIGGTKFSNFSAELRAPIWGNLSGVAFIDGGIVWADRSSAIRNDTGWRYDAGPGLRYRTPIGPIRVDLGYQLNPLPGLLVNGEPQPRRFRVHFSIGQAF